MAARTNEIFKTLGHPDRLRVLQAVLERDHALTSELAAALDLPQPATSQALAALARDGLVARGRERTPYRVPRPRETRALLAAALLIHHAHSNDPNALAEARALKKDDMARGASEPEPAVRSLGV